VRAMNSTVMGGLSNPNGGNQVSVEQIKPGAPPPSNALVPRSDAAPATAGAPGGLPVPGQASTAIPELQNDLQPAAAADASSAPEKAPPQVNDAVPAADSSSTSTPAASSTSGTPAPAANPTTESTSKKEEGVGYLLEV